jgi:hypothetical protein
VTLLVSELEPWRLAFSADRVEVVADARGSEGEDGVFDLARHFGQTSSVEPSAQRTLGMRTVGGELCIAVPTKLWVETVEVEAIMPLPVFVAPALRRLGVEALVVLEAGLAFVVDVDLLAESLRGGEAA